MEKTEQLNSKMFELLNKYHKTGNETDEIKSLIEQGADVNAKDKEKGYTPLHYASGEYDYDKLGNGNINLVSFLVSKGADVNMGDNDGSTPLINSALNGNVEIAKYLIKHGAKVNAKDRTDYTPLMATQLAISENQDTALQIAKLLIENHADVDMRDNSGKTALDYQKDKQEQYKNKEMIQLLKDTSTNNLFESIQAYSLHEEGRDFIVEHIKKSLENGADINCVKDCQEHIEIEEDDGLHYYTKQLYGYNIKSATPLMLAVNDRNYDLSKMLIENGANVNIKNKEGETALMKADAKTAKLLIDNGAWINTKDNNGKTALDIIESPTSRLNDKESKEFRDLIISKGGKRGNEIKSKVKAKAKTKQKSNDFGMSM